MINTILLLINLIALSAIIYFVYRKFEKYSMRMAKENEAIFDAMGNLMLEVKAVKDAIDEGNRQVQDIIVSPNRLKQLNEKTVPLAEESPWQIPKDVKVEVEGGDTNIPYSYGS